MLLTGCTSLWYMTEGSHDSPSFCTERNLQILVQVGRKQVDYFWHDEVRRKRKGYKAAEVAEFVEKDRREKGVAQKRCSRNLHKQSWIQSYEYKGSDFIRSIREQILGSCEMIRGSGSHTVLGNRHSDEPEWRNLTEYSGCSIKTPKGPQLGNENNLTPDWNSSRPTEIVTIIKPQRIKLRNQKTNYLPEENLTLSRRKLQNPESQKCSIYLVLHIINE